MTASKGFLVGIFVNRNKILSFLEEIKNTFNVLFDKVFIYSIESNSIEYLVTFKAFDKSILGEIPNSSVMHVKNGCIFSINALNKLIDSEKEDVLPNNEFIVEWDKYKDTLIVLTGGKLNIKKISKISDKCSFLS